MDQALNMEALDELRNLMGDALDEVLQTFVDYVPGQIDELSQAVSNDDAEGVFNLAHKMKSSSSSIGALGLASVAEQIEVIGRTGSTQGAAELLEKLKALYSDAETILHQQLNK
jgi:HPt (histidine-containing phosphotransfer) domain-containing protein